MGLDMAIVSTSRFVTQDAAGSPLVSPLAYTGSVTTLAVPVDAVQLILAPTTDLRISEDSGAARYDLVAAGSKEAFPVAGMSAVYIRRDSADGSLRFRFTVV